MKQWSKVFLALAMTLALTIGGSALAYAAEGEICVSGTGVVQADPDTADVRLSIETTGKTAEQAQQENNKLVQKVTQAMLEQGATKDDITTAYSYVYPMYQYNDETGERTVTGYKSSTDLEVTTKDIDHTGKFIDAALAAGVSGTGGVSFYLADQSAVYTQALQLAAKNAAKSAESIAAAFGKPLGAVKSVSELSDNYYATENFMPRTEAAMDSNAGAAYGGTSISYGKITVRAELSVCYGF